MDAATWLLTLRAGTSGKVLASCQAQQPTAVLHGGCESDRLFCALGSHVVYLHGDAIVAEGELPDATPVACLAGNSKQLFAGTRSGLFVSDDNGQSWESIEDSTPIVALHKTATGQMYAVEMGGQLREINKENT